MRDVHAFIVGIDRYDESADWALEGPVANACAIADQLLTAGVPPENIALFLECDGAPPAAVAALEAKGLTPKGDGSYRTIDNHWRELDKDVPAGSRLFVFWSGHGVTESQAERRLFMCSDYTQRRSNRVFNADNFRRLLKAELGAKFTSQRLFADVCGTYATMKVTPVDDEAGRMRPTDQVAYYASPEGEYAVSKEGLGAFTTAVLDALDGFADWLDEEALGARFKAAFGRLEVQACRVSHFGVRDTQEGYLVGQQRATDLPPGPARSALACLETLPLPDRSLRLHFRRTIGQLGRRDLDAFQGLSGMVRALAELQDGTAERASFGLAQFMMRVATERTSPALDQWIDGHVSTQSRAELDERLARERPEKRLLIEVYNDASATIRRFKASLRNPDLSVPSESRHIAEEVSGWDAFAERIAEIVEETKNVQRGSRLEIDFLVDVPLFDKPFHRIDLPSGGTIGERFKCVVHYLRRDDTREEWDDYCRNLRGVTIAELRRLRIPGHPLPVPRDKGICFASFPVATGKGTPAEKQITRVLWLGAPYLCWAHASVADPAQSVADEMDALVQGAGALEGIPDELKRRRIAGDGIAHDVSLLWDDPDFRPHEGAEGPRP